MPIAITIDPGVTVARAAIKFVSVPIIARLKTHLALAEVCANHGVTADRRATVGPARIMIFCVAVIALFKLIIIRPKVGTRHPITADGEGAIVRAGVGRHLVPIVTGFICLKVAVTALSGRFTDHDLL